MIFAPVLFLVSSIVSPTVPVISDMCNLGQCLNYWQQYKLPVTEAEADKRGYSKLSYRFCMNFAVTGTVLDTACRLARADLKAGNQNNAAAVKSYFTQYVQKNLRSFLATQSCSPLINNLNYASVAACAVAGTGPSPAWPY